MQDILDRLTIRTKARVQRDDGSIHEAAYSEPLIAQLREAIHGEEIRSGAPSSSKERLPLSVPALDLYQSIDDRVTELWVQRFQRAPGIEHPEVLLRAIVEGMEPADLVMYNVKFTVQTPQASTVKRDLVSQSVLAFLMELEESIVNLLERPTTRVPVKGPCPAAGCHREAVEVRMDGETVVAPTLEFEREVKSGRTVAVICRSCDTVWPESQFREFAEALGRLEREHLYGAKKL